MRSKLKLSRSLVFISAFFKAQQVINTRGGANLAPPGSDRVNGTLFCGKTRIVLFVAINYWKQK